jgi:arylsulfatase A-like enzyme
MTKDNGGYMAKNVLLITIDSLRADHLSCLGYHRKITPKMDELAKKGILFSQAIANGSGTPSAVPPILTSTYPLMYGGYERLSKQRVAIAEVLKQSGYSTAAFHSNTYLSRFYGYQRGFDVFYDDLTAKTEISTYSSLVRKARKAAQKIMLYISATIFPHKKSSWPLPYVNAKALNQKAVSWLANNRPERFFLWIHYMDVHSPFMAPKDFIEEINEDISRREVLRLNKRLPRPRELSKKDLTRLIDLYDACIKHTDSAVSSLLDEIERLGLLKETMVIITADHGEEFLEHGDLGHNCTMYDELIHVPLIFFSPDWAAGKTIDSQVEHLDIAPTVLDALGIKKPANFLGDSLLPLMNGEELEKGIITESSNPPNELRIDPKLRRTSYRTRTWKYIHNASRENELYKLSTDPKETKNLVEEEKDLARSLHSKIQNHIAMEMRLRLQLESELLQDKIRRLKLEGKLASRPKRINAPS